MPATTAGRVGPVAEDRGERERAICERIALARKASGLTQEELANLLEVIPRTVQLYEHDRVPWKELPTIARLTGRPLEWFLRGDEAYEDGDVRASLRRELAGVERHILDRVAARLDPMETTINETAELVRELVASLRQADRPSLDA